MAFEIPDFLPGIFVANADLSADQYKILKIAAAGPNVALCAAATDLPVGVLQNTPDASGKSAKVMVSGITKGVANGVIAIGAQVGTDAAGLFDSKAAGVDTTEFVIGSCLLAAAGASEVRSFLIETAAPSRAA